MTDLLKAIDDLMSCLVAVRAQLAAESAAREQVAARCAAPAVDPWIGQRGSPLRALDHTRLCRELIKKGDPRAALRLRIHYIRQSALEEAMRAQPWPARRAAPPIVGGAR